MPRPFLKKTEKKKTLPLGIEQKFYEPFGGSIPCFLKHEIECTVKELLKKKALELNTSLGLYDSKGTELFNNSVVQGYSKKLQKDLIFNLGFCANDDGTIDMYSSELGYIDNVTQGALDSMKVIYLGNIYEKWELL